MSAISGLMNRNFLNKRVFIDSSAWLALINTEDIHHQLAKNIFERIVNEKPEILTSTENVSQTVENLQAHTSLDLVTTYLKILKAAQEDSRFVILEANLDFRQKAISYLKEHDYLKVADALTLIMYREYSDIALFSFNEAIRKLAARCLPAPAVKTSTPENKDSKADSDNLHNKLTPSGLSNPELEAACIPIAEYIKKSQFKTPLPFSLSDCKSFNGALQASSHITEVLKKDESHSSNDWRHWHIGANALLAPMLYAISNNNRKTTDLLRWLELSETDEPLSLLVDLMPDAELIRLGQEKCDEDPNFSKGSISAEEFKKIGIQLTIYDPNRLRSIDEDGNSIEAAQAILRLHSVINRPEKERLTIFSTAYTTFISFTEQQSALTPSVSLEESLPLKVDEVVEDICLGVLPFTMSETTVQLIKANKETAKRIILIYASCLYPLSRLIYGAELENITCLAHNQWIGQKGAQKFQWTSLNIAGPNSEIDDSDIALISFFKRILAIKGVTGDTTLSSENPIAEANFGTVMRLTVAIKPALSGNSNINVSIRIPRRVNVQGLESYVTAGIMPEEMVQFLKKSVVANANILIAGGTGTGKTTLLRALCQEVPDNQLIATLEDGAELNLDSPIRKDSKTPNVIAFATSPRTSNLTLLDLVRQALRFMPDRIILGESRGAEMASICKALMSGHSGSMTTIHASSAPEAIEQAKQYILEDYNFNGRGISDKFLNKMALSTFDLIILLEIQDGNRVITIWTIDANTGNTLPIFNQDETGKIVCSLKEEDFPPKLKEKFKNIE